MLLVNAGSFSTPIGYYWTMGHHHDHHPEHLHGVHAGASIRVLIAVIAINGLFILIEMVVGLASGSTALIADAGHNLSDVLGLVATLGALRLAALPATSQFSYGLGASSILAALFNGVLLMLGCGALAWEAAHRLSETQAVASQAIIVVAAIGIGVNALSAWWLMRTSPDDLNMRGAYLHMAADAAVSLGVVLAGIIIHFTGWHIVDPLVSLMIVLMIAATTWGLLRQSLRLALGGVPQGIELAKVETLIKQTPGINSVSDLHVWALSTSKNALTAHVVAHDHPPGDAQMEHLAQELQKHFGIAHSTIQVHEHEAPGCPLAQAAEKGAAPGHHDHPHAPHHRH